MKWQNTLVKPNGSISIQFGEMPYIHTEFFRNEKLNPYIGELNYCPENKNFSMHTKKDKDGKIYTLIAQKL